MDSSVAGGFLQVWRDLAAEEAATLGSSQIWKTWESMELQSWRIHSGNRVGVTAPKLGGHRVSVSMLGPCGEVAQEIWDTEVPGRRAASLGMWVGVRWLEIW